MLNSLLFEKSDVKLVFSNLATLIEFSKKFCGRLKMAIPEDRIGLTFKDTHEDLMRVYAEYCKNNEAAIVKAGEWMNGNKEVTSFLNVSLYTIFL